jgi:hypothetical protein
MDPEAWPIPADLGLKLIPVDSRATSSPVDVGSRLSNVEPGSRFVPAYPDSRLILVDLDASPVPREMGTREACPGIVTANSPMG